MAGSCYEGVAYGRRQRDRCNGGSLRKSLPQSRELLSKAFNCQDNQIGYIAFIKGGFAGGDVFGSTNVCRRKMEKLVRGYYLDSLDDAVLFEKIDIAAMLEEERNAQHNDLGTVGKGTERRLKPFTCKDPGKKSRARFNT